MFFAISGYCIANAAMRSLAAPSPAKHFLTALAALLSLALTVLVDRHVVASSQIADPDAASATYGIVNPGLLELVLRSCLLCPHRRYPGPGGQALVVTQILDALY